VRKQLAFVAMATLLACSGSARGEKPLESFQTFWKAFRESIVSAKPDATAALTEFPLKTRGTLDDAPVHSVDRAGFAGTLEEVLRQDPGLSSKPDTMRELILRTETVDERAMSGSGMARVGSLVFSNTAAGWRLTMAYTED
jgi:hypothetical protein